MKIFVTGGAGYIGSTAALKLTEAGHQVTVYDSLVTGHLAAVPEKAKFIHANLNDSSALAAALQEDKYDAIMHFAAFIEAGESMKNPGKFFRNNVVNSMQLIELAVKSGIKQFVFSSTAAVYASSDNPLSETSSIGPTSVYGHTKLMVEQTLDWYRKIHGLHVGILRYFNAAGAMPGRGEAHQPETHLIPITLQVALGQRDAIHIFGADYPTPDGTCIRDYIHISDLVDAHLLTLDALQSQDLLLYNLGNGIGYTNREVIDTARKVTGHTIPAIDSPRRAGDAARLIASSDKIRRELGWEPKIPELKAIITSAWNWHAAHPNGYDG